MITISTLSRARQILINCRRARFICNLTLTCTLCRFAIASHAYFLRSARALLPKLLETRSRWPPRSAERPFP
eukprot:6189162-Pleurochrysis_carterae.AAC.1